MSKAIFFNIPASGHIYPSLAMTRELVRRGERILYVATERFRGVIEATGAEFRAYASLEDGYIDRPGLNGTNPQLAAELMIGTCRELLPELLALVEAEAPDYIVHDSMCPWGALTARILGLPTVVSLALWKFTPAMLGPGPGADDPEALRRGTAHAIRYHQLSRQIAAEFGIRPLAYTELFNAPGDLTISYSSPEIQPEGHRLDGSIHFVGSSLETRGDEPGFPPGPGRNRSAGASHGRHGPPATGRAGNSGGRGGPSGTPGAPGSIPAPGGDSSGRTPGGGPPSGARAPAAGGRSRGDSRADTGSGGWESPQSRRSAAAAGGNHRAPQ